jgi:hypothetical protein
LAVIPISAIGCRVCGRYPVLSTGLCWSHAEKPAAPPPPPPPVVKPQPAVKRKTLTQLIYEKLTDIPGLSTEQLAGDLDWEVDRIRSRCYAMKRSGLLYSRHRSKFDNTTVWFIKEKENAQQSDAHR